MYIDILKLLLSLMFVPVLLWFHNSKQLGLKIKHMTDNLDESIS